MLQMEEMDDNDGTVEIEGGWLVTLVMLRAC